MHFNNHVCLEAHSVALTVAHSHLRSKRVNIILPKPKPTITQIHTRPKSLYILIQLLASQP